MKFVHLHNHSDYSILDGSITIDGLIEKTIALEMPGVALTDHGNMFGAIEFYEKARARGIIPILGQEFYVAPTSRFARESKAHGKDSSYHLLLLAKNAEGYKNLIRLSSIGYTEGFYYKPRIDMEVLEKHAGGVIALSACLGGEIPTLILQNSMKEAAALAGKFQELFGRDHFYLELQDHGIPEQKTVNRELLGLSEALNIPLVATNDCHYTEKEDHLSHDVLLCIQTGKFLDEESRMRFPTDKFYFRSTQEMVSLFAELPDAIYNTMNILEMTDLRLSLGEAILPHFEVPGGFTLDSYLKHLVIEGAKKLFGEVRGEVLTRIDYELSVITRMQFSGYFLIVWDFINYAKRNGIPVGPGRGSAAGSMVSYCLGITNLDPMKYNLLFERFLNPDRNEMPDMDIDFCAERREEVINYVKKKYGEDQVSQIITFNRLKAKAVIKDVARVLRIPFTEANLISKHIMSDSLSEELKTSGELKKIYTGTDKGKTLIDISLSLEGHVRSAGKHAAGVVISRGPMMEYAPLYRDSRDGSISTQYEKNTLEKAGLVKMDFLGLKNLTIIDKCLKHIERNHGMKLDPGAFPMDDEETYQLLQRGDTNGVFQLESAGMQNVLRKLGPTCFEDIIAVNALYRPGPLNSGMVDDFIKRKRNPKSIEYPHAVLEPILRDTLGVIVYQEQVMLISQMMGGFSLSEADMLRKAMGKKKMEIIDQMEEKFLGGAKSKGIPKNIAMNIYNAIRKFGEYGFNKSHSAAYALISYYTAYLKTHYTVEYMCSLLSAVTDNQEDVIRYVNDCRYLGIQILPPDVNKSLFDFTNEGETIRFGLSAIKGIGEKAIESVLSARKKSGGFGSLREFLELIDLFAVNKGALESLIKAGALDSIHPNRAQLLMNVELLIEKAKGLQRDRESGQGSLFGEGGGFGDPGASIDMPFFREWHDNEKLLHEKEVLGLYLSGHPLAKYESEIRSFACTSIKDLSERNQGESVTIVGVIYNLKVRTSKMGKKFAVGMVEDMEGTIEAVFVPNTYSTYESLITMDEPIMLKGKAEFEDETVKSIIINEVRSLRDIRRDSISAVHIRLDLLGMDEGSLSAIKSIIEKNSGDCPVLFHVKAPASAEKTVRAHSTYNVTPTDALIRELSRIVGPDAIRYSLKGCR